MFSLFGERRSRMAKPGLLRKRQELRQAREQEQACAAAERSMRTLREQEVREPRWFVRGREVLVNAALVREIVGPGFDLRALRCRITTVTDGPPSHTEHTCVAAKDLEAELDSGLHGEAWLNALEIFGIDRPDFLCWSDQDLLGLREPPKGWSVSGTDQAHLRERLEQAQLRLPIVQELPADLDAWPQFVVALAWAARFGDPREPAVRRFEEVFPIELGFKHRDFPRLLWILSRKGIWALPEDLEEEPEASAEK
jgi:hypothetical protein